MLPLRDDEDAAVAQRGQLGAEPEVVVERSLSALMLSCTTGMSASGKACTSTDQVPWSMPQESTSAPTQVGCTASETSCGQLGQPGRGVVDVEQALREAEEVVDGARAAAWR